MSLDDETRVIQEETRVLKQQTQDIKQENLMTQAEDQTLRRLEKEKDDLHEKEQETMRREEDANKILFVDGNSFAQQRVLDYWHMEELRTIEKHEYTAFILRQ